MPGVDLADSLEQDLPGRINNFIAHVNRVHALAKNRRARLRIVKARGLGDMSRVAETQTVNVAGIAQRLVHTRRSIQAGQSRGYGILKEWTEKKNAQRHCRRQEQEQQDRHHPHTDITRIESRHLPWAGCPRGRS